MSLDKSQIQIDSGFYRDKDGKLLIVDKDGNVVRLDFDIDKLNLPEQTDQTIKNKNIESESDMDLENSSETTDLTSEQLEENYWVETSKTKFDGSTAMMEKRISGCMEVTGKSREECSKEVKTRMIKEGSDNTNTTDTKDEEEEETEEEEEEEEKTDNADEKTDTIEICSKELDMLKEKAERLDTIEAELEAEKASKEDMQTQFDKITKIFDVIQAERAEELEIKRQEKIKQISTDFNVPEENLKDKSVKRLEEDMELLDMAIKKNVEEEGIIEIDMKDLESDFTKRSNALTELYKIKVVK